MRFCLTTWQAAIHYCDMFQGLVATPAPPLDIPQDEELAELGGTPSHVHATPKV